MKKIITKLIGLYLNVLAVIAPRKAGKIGFELFCKPFRGKLTNRHHTFFQSAIKSTINHKNETIQVYTWGTGSEKVLFLHGWQSHTYRWKNYIEALDKNKYTVYALDAPGHGLSSGNFLTVPLYGEVIKSLIDRIGSVNTIVGHSLGAFTAIYSVFENPQLTPEKLIALAPPGEARQFFNFYSDTLSLSKRNERLTSERFEEVVGKTPSYFSASSFAKDFNMNGLLIHDEEDDETSVENSKAIHQAWRRSTLIITKGKGHNLKSQEVINETLNFIDQGSTQKHVRSTINKELV
ncbi:MAG TPA: alpha/beta hydrolase [Chryseolinea sp.]|nr:alpha/beta hydrolase [Chryseolinea sp.]HPH45369.1 alpha/beta hydrolase [Chryseolinea sp.]HPM28722.1 alpha/beta hydrolase [Chryseolinea sp.]